MRQLIASSWLVAASFGKATVKGQAEMYPYMDEAMRVLGLDYSWQAYETVTNDGYVLTMFRITGDADGNTIEGQGSKGPLLVQHGFTSDSISWFDVSDFSKPALPVMLFQEGFDVWLGNNRGTRHSRRHMTYDADIDWQYWDFSHHEYGAFDLPTMVKTIVQVSGTCTKVSYLGHSLGSMQVFYGMGRGKYMQPYFSQVVALAPCFIPSSETYIPFLDKSVYATFSGVMELLNIESLFGPKWSSQLATLCDFLGKDSQECTFLKSMKVGELAGGEIDGLSEIGVQQTEQIAQVVIEQRFQYYEENFFLNDLFNIKGKLINTSNIREPPFKFLFIDGDKICPPDLNKEYARKVPAYVSETDIYGRDHAYVVGDNDDEFFATLMANLQDANEPLSFANCDKLMNK